MPNGDCLGPDGFLLDRLFASLGRPKGLEPVKDTWREASQRVYANFMAYNINNKFNFIEFCMHTYQIKFRK